MPSQPIAATKRQRIIDGSHPLQLHRSQPSRPTKVMRPQTQRRPRASTASETPAFESVSVRRRRNGSLGASDRSSTFIPSSGALEHEIRDQENVKASRSYQPTDDFDTEPDSTYEIVMAINATDRGAIGCAYYVAREEKLYFMEEIKYGGSDLVDTLKTFIDPTIVLVSTKCGQEMLDRLDTNLRNPTLAVEGERGDQTRLPYLLNCRPSSEFGYDAAKKKLINLRLGQVGGPVITYVVPGDVVTYRQDGSDNAASFIGQQGQLLRLSSWINTEGSQTVGCAGAVLSYLERRRASTYLPGDEDAVLMFPVYEIEMFTLTGTMFINADTLFSLQITSVESHPNARQHRPASKNHTSGSKEGQSVYGLFHHLARTTQGRNLLRQYFYRPSRSLEIITDRLDTVSVLISPENTPALDRLGTALATIKNMRVVTINLRKGISGGSHKRFGLAASIWHSVRHFLFSSLQITDIFEEIEGGARLSIRVKIYNTFEKRRLAEIGRLICDTVDFESSKHQHRTVILPGVDQELDEAKRTYNGIEDLLCQVATQIASRVPAGVNSTLNVIFFPQVGFLISIALDPRLATGVYEGPSENPWERIFVTESHAYYRNTYTNELDHRFGDVYGHICDREIEIAQGLAQRVLEYEELLHSTSDICGELDCLIALSVGAKLYNLVRPEVTEENIVKIKGGRHPLRELTVSSFVPNDTYVVGGVGCDAPDETGNVAGLASTRPPSAGPSMVLMTGPNFSGKSVYLKQVAIIVYMAHIGSFVPAEAARVGLTDKILTRMNTRESVSRVQSSFSIDLQQMSMALNQATRHSLVIIDEFGKGTQAQDGAGLVAGVLEHFLNRGTECPKVLAATHFHEIFEGGFMIPRPSLAFAHMQVKVSDVDDQITYLYNYRAGRSNASYGTYCAAMNGIAPEVVARAEELALLAARGENLVETCAQIKDADLAELADAEDVARRLLSCERFETPRHLLQDILRSSPAECGSHTWSR